MSSIYSKSKQFDTLKLVMDNINDLDPWTDTFSLRHVWPDSYDVTVTADHLPDPWPLALGTWELPPRFSSDGNGMRYVNPNCKTKGYYSDIGVKCKCGNYVKKLARGHVKRNRQHAEDCCESYKMETDKRLINKRKLYLTHAAEYNITQKEAANRLDMKQQAVDYFTKRYLPYNYGQRRLNRGRPRLGKYWDTLRDDGYTFAEIADVFDVGNSTVRDYIDLWRNL